MDFRAAIGIGVAGNFTGHLEQAGEASDFVNVSVKDASAPKGIFPFYVPGAGEHFLSHYPISADQIVLPADAQDLQIEPEVALHCELEYSGDRVAKVVPRRFGAHNDCSIRREGAKKISEKKNWGIHSKGTAERLLELDRFAPGGVLDHYRIACWLERDGALHGYGVDSAVTSYSYVYERLLDWLVEKLNEQPDEGPLESLARWLDVAGHPKQALISIGATRYTPFGESTYLALGDRAIVAVYDARRYDSEAIRALATSAEGEAAEGVSMLRQRVVAAS
jgi:hypothetical protein